MIPSQTSEVLLGTVMALFYAGMVLVIGTLILAGLLGRQLRAAIHARMGLWGLMWLGFVMGQGVLGALWLGLSLVGILHSSLIWFVCTLGWALGCLVILRLHRQTRHSVERIWVSISSFLNGHNWYFWMGAGIVTVCLLRGLIALLPTAVDDALYVYLVLAKAIAASHTVELQPFVQPSFGLLPLQIEMHWAALFLISNETAITVWDYLCALSFLSAVGLLTLTITASRRAALLAVLMMLSTPAFYEMMGGGKTDNAAAQYGVAAFLSLVLWPALSRRSVVLASSCLGWMVASRYTNIIVIPAFILFAIMLVRRSRKVAPADSSPQKLEDSWVSLALIGCIAAGIAVVPMLVKNWLLVGCPLAPQFGCQETFWASIYKLAHITRQNISVHDLFFYPFVWTFASRQDMLGNISPLFVGFFPFLLTSRCSTVVRPALMAGLAGLVSIGTWWLVKPLILYTRWLLIPLALFTIPLSASAVAAEQDFRQNRTAQWLSRGAMVATMIFLLFQSRGIVYATRYLASVDSRTARYESMPGYDVAFWLNTHVRPGERVALSGWSGYAYFVNADHLLNSESAEELQWLWHRYASISPSSWTSDYWHFYSRSGFTYIIVGKSCVSDALSVWPCDVVQARPHLVFAGRDDAILRMERAEPTKSLGGSS
jgi:hypothetical protein